MRAIANTVNVGDCCTGMMLKVLEGRSDVVSVCEELCTIALATITSAKGFEARVEARFVC